MSNARPYGRILEPLAWRFLTVLYRRHHRHLGGISEMHPGGGQYDVRALFDASGDPVVLINLGSSLEVLSPCSLRVEGPALWPRLAADSFDGVLDEVSTSLGLPEDAGEPTAVWTYRFHQFVSPGRSLSPSGVEMRRGTRRHFG